MMAGESITPDGRYWYTTMQLNGWSFHEDAQGVTQQCMSAIASEGSTIGSGIVRWPSCELVHATIGEAPKQSDLSLQLQR